MTINKDQELLAGLVKDIAHRKIIEILASIYEDDRQELLKIESSNLTLDFDKVILTIPSINTSFHMFSMTKLALHAETLETAATLLDATNVNGSQLRCWPSSLTVLPQHYSATSNFLVPKIKFKKL